MKTMRPTLPNLRLTVAAALGAALLATVLAAPARAEESRPLDEQIIHNILTGLGLQDPNAPQPTYEERPPLVIPKGDTLPPPQSAGSVIANNPAWPKDPDIQRAKALAKRDKNRDVQAEMLRENNQLLPDQLGPKGQGPRPIGRPDNSRGDISGRGKVMSPSELGYTGGLFSNMFGSDKDDQRTAQFTSEPARTSLTEPPPGYQTPSPDQPYGLGKQNSAPKADNSYLTRGEADPNQ